MDGTLCDPDIGRLQESDLAQLRNFVHNNRYVLERIAENDLYSEDQIASQLIVGGAAASEEAIADVPETIGPTGSELFAQDLDCLKNLIVRNKAVLIAHWNGAIGSEEVVRGLVF